MAKDKLNDLEKKTIREFDELWNSGSARMRGEADRVGLDEEAFDRLVKTVHAYLVYFMGTASMMPELLKDTYARCSLMLLEDATSMMSVLGDAPCELFVKMCREQLEAVIKLHDGASGN